MSHRLNFAGLPIKFAFNLTLALLVAALAGAPTRAQPVAVPPTFLSEAAQILTPDFVRQADTILVARVSPDPRQPGVARVNRTDYELIRGDRFNVGRGLILPTGETLDKTSPLSLFFAVTDPIRQQPVILARLEATPELIEQTRQLAQKNQKITVTFSTDKTSYLPDEPIVIKWEARNASPGPQRIYTGQYALQYTAIYGGSARGTGTGGSQTRKDSDYITLAPGESWTQTREVRGPFPQGEVRIEMTLDSSDNYLGSDPRNAEARAARQRVEGVALFVAKGEISAEISAPSPAAQKELAARLSSPNWSEALAAATTLSQLEGAGQLPAMRALASHPWSALRIAAATALARGATEFSPALRALATDPDRRVRSETFEALVKNRVPGAGLTALAVKAVEAQAVELNVLSEKQKTGYTSMVLTNLRDDNRDLGELLRARIENGRANADGINAPSFLNGLAENGRNLRLTGDKTATPEQEKAVVQAWKDATEDVKPANLKSRTSADLEAEIAAARARMFGDFKVGPGFAAVVENLGQIAAKGSFPAFDNANRQFLESLAPDARPDVLRALQWQTGREGYALESLPALKRVAQIAGPLQNEARNFLLEQLYGGLNRDGRAGISVSDEVAYAAAIALGNSEGAFARPHLEIALQSPNAKIAAGAAIGLFVGGQKSALPAVFEPERWQAVERFGSQDLEKALAQTTGLTFVNRYEIRKWWDQTGSKMEWK